MTVWNKADGYRVNGYSPMTWLITITRNRAVDRRRALRQPPAPIETADLMPDSSRARRHGDCAFPSAPDHEVP